jgi:hypothetical protein
MMVGASDTQQGTFDLCVAGGGPAGIIVALEYVKRRPNARVLLVEFGERGAAPRNRLDDAIAVDNDTNHHPPYECTNKGLGGTTASWGGRCVMYDAVDFTPRDAVGQGCTWTPELLNEVRSFTPAAASYFECGRPIFDLSEIKDGRQAPIAERFRPGPVTDTVVERWSPPTRFGARYRRALDESKSIQILEGWGVDSVVKSDAAAQLLDVSIQDAPGREVRVVKSKRCVIAAGAQETTRLLLRNASLFASIGGPPPSLGRYYQGHVSGKIASVRFYGDPRQTQFGFDRDDDGTYVRRRFQFAPDTLRAEGLLNIALWLDNPLYFDPAHRSGSMSLMYLAMLAPLLGKRLAPPAIAKSVTQGRVTGLPAHVWNVIKDVPSSLWTPASIFVRRYLSKRALPGVFLYSKANLYALHFHSEQVPVESNRMVLGPDGHSLSIHYELTDADVESVIRSHDLLDSWLRQCGCGELVYWMPASERAAAIRQMSRDGIHQVGTTRIGADPSQGVVDDDLRLFGTSNVYVCSSSVFPTSGQANPTFMLGAFAARLGAHLAAA